MPNWEGIEDASAKASRVWLVRPPPASSPTKTAVEVPWKPLRKSDCQALNVALDQGLDECVIEGGRATAFLKEGVVRNNFYRGSMELCSAIWFLKDERNKEVVLMPVKAEMDSIKIEDFYQKIVQACSSLGKGLASLESTEIVLEHETKVVLQKSPLKLIWKGKGWFGHAFDLQRGYGEYKVEGEEDEEFLGEVGHLVFVIHGIGYDLFSRENVKLPSWIEEMDSARIALHHKQVQDYKDACARALKLKQPEPPKPKRIELIPIEWFSRLHDSSTALMRSLRSATLPTIPALRAIANDVVFDVLMYLTPAFCQSVLDCVTEQICDNFVRFKEIHNFAGPVSLIGHSLGSVIVWDLLSILKEKQEGPPKMPSVRGMTIATEGDSAQVGYAAYAQAGNEHANTPSHGTWGPSLVHPMAMCIPFQPDCAILLGSPLGIFLTLRGAHAVFDEMRRQAVEDAKSEASAGKNSLDEHVHVPSASPFTLPTRSLFNIFHPSDPVAYRIEPLLLSQDMEPAKLPPPMYLTAPGKDVRLHVKARLIGDEFKKNFQEQKSAWNALLDTTLSVLSTTKTETEASTPKATMGQEIETAWPPTYPLGCPERPKEARVDYSFQPGVVENEYINAVLAHSSYLINDDLIEFLARRIGLASDDILAPEMFASDKKP